MINKKVIEEIIEINTFINNGIIDGTINKDLKNDPSSYNLVVKPKLIDFKKHNKKSANSLFKDELDSIMKNYGLNDLVSSTAIYKYWGRQLNNHVWAPLYSKKDGVRNSIQLYISAWYEGIKFGLCYGDDVKENSKFVKVVKEDSSINEKLYSIISSNPNIKFYGSFPKETEVNSGENLADLWGDRSQVLGLFKKDQIPDDAGKIIQNILTELAPVFNEIIIKSTDENMQVNEPNSEVKYPKKDEEGDSKPKHPLNQILYGPPGTGKTFNTVNKAIQIINPNFDLEQTRNRKDVKTEFDRLMAEGRIVFTTFHQSMSYEDFVEGIKPQEPKSEGQNVTYSVEDGIFKKICIKALEKKASNNFDEVYEKFINDVLESGPIELSTLVQKKPFTVRINSNGSSVCIPKTTAATEMVITRKMIYDYLLEGKIRDWKPYTTALAKYLKSNYKLKIEDSPNSNKPFVLIIDEINRGNISAIFGELITLIEEDKRIGGEENLKVVLPYSKNEIDKFGVPPNLYIIGTMNTADRSVEALDSALRRRFNFEEMPPKPEIIAEFGDLSDENGVIIENKNFPIDMVRLLETMNERIEVLVDRDHTIGHSYFMSVKNIQDLKNAFHDKIIPLLQEYFYGDYGKMEMVIGPGFFEDKKDKSKITFAFNNNDFQLEGAIYKLLDVSKFNNKEMMEALSLLKIKGQKELESVDKKDQTE